MSGRRARSDRRFKQTEANIRLDEKLIHDPIGQSSLTARPDLIQNVSYIAEPVYPEGHPRYGKSNRGKGSLGIYEAIYILAIPGRNITQTDVNFAERLEEGDSLLVAPEAVDKIQIAIENTNDPQDTVVLTVGVNKFNRFSSISTRLTAQSFAHAAQVAHDLVMPILSRWSYQHDIAITTSALQLVELATGSARWDTMIVPATKSFGDIEGASTAEGRVLLAAFREGMSSLEPLYRALCMFRVIEGCYVLRSRRRVRAATNDEQFIDPGEKLELDQITALNPRSQVSLQASFNPYLGWKFTKLRDVFKKDIRHAVAHLDLDGNPLAADIYDDIQKVVNALPVMHHVARTLLAAELNETNG